MFTTLFLLPIWKTGQSFFWAAFVCIVFFWARTVNAQENQVISNIIRGSVVGLGWSAGGSSGNINKKVYFDCSSCTTIGNVYLIGMDAIAVDTNYTFVGGNIQINNHWAYFSESTSVGQRFFESNNSSHKCHVIEFDFECNGTDSIVFNLPSQDWEMCMLGYFLVIECIDLDAASMGYTILLNTSDNDPNLNVSSSHPVQLISINENEDVGFSIVGNVMNFMNGDGSNVTFNGNLLGKIAGQDESSSLFWSSGVRGHFQYSNGTLEGLDDDTPDLIMDSTDALANVQIMLNTTNDFYFSVVHEQPLTTNAYYTNPVLASILTYTSLCDTFSVSVPKDTTVCFGAQLPLVVSGGVAYEWYPATSLSCTDCPNPIFTADSSVFYTVKIWSNDSCFVSKPLKINVVPAIEFDSIGISPSECGENSGSVYFPYMGIGYSFTTVGGSTMNNVGNFQNLPSGFHTFFIQNAQGCQSVDTTVFVPEINSTSVSFSANPLSGVSPLEVDIENTSSNATNFEWFVNGESYGLTLLGVLLSQEGNYVIELVGWNTTNLCSDTSLITILVYDSLILNIPNVFTPNNDGVNDVFSIQSNQDAQLNVTILNRWGNSVFTGNIQLQSGVLVPIWDGGVSPDGVYFIELNVTTMKGEIIENGGFISLER